MNSRRAFGPRTTGGLIHRLLLRTEELGHGGALIERVRLYGVRRVEVTRRFFDQDMQNWIPTVDTVIAMGIRSDSAASMIVLLSARKVSGLA